MSFFIYPIMVSANKDSFASSLPSWTPVIFFLIALARTSSRMLKCESGHPCLSPGENIQTFTIYSTMLIVGFSKMLFVRLKKVPSIPSVLRIFVRNRCGILLNALFFVSVGMIIWFFFFNLLI